MPQLSHLPTFLCIVVEERNISRMLVVSQRPCSGPRTTTATNIKLSFMSRRHATFNYKVSEWSASCCHIRLLSRSCHTQHNGLRDLGINISSLLAVVFCPYGRFLSSPTPSLILAGKSQIQNFPKSSSLLHFTWCTSQFYIWPFYQTA